MHDVVHICGACKNFRNTVRVKNKSEVRVAAIFFHGADALAQKRCLFGFRGGRRGQFFFLAVDKLLIHGDLLFNERDRLTVERDLLIERRFSVYDQRLIIGKILYDLLLLRKLFFKLRSLFRQSFKVGLIDGVRRKDGDHKREHHNESQHNANHGENGFLQFVTFHRHLISRKGKSAVPIRKAGEVRRRVGLHAVDTDLKMAVRTGGYAG